MGYNFIKLPWRDSRVCCQRVERNKLRRRHTFFAPMNAIENVRELIRRSHCSQTGLFFYTTTTSTTETTGTMTIATTSHTELLDVVVILCVTSWIPTTDDSDMSIPSNEKWLFPSDNSYSLLSIFIYNNNNSNSNNNNNNKKLIAINNIYKIYRDSIRRILSAGSVSALSYGVDKCIS